jgi:pyruvyltransferase
MQKLMYWANDNNFGDALNPYIQKAFGISAKCAPAEYSDLIGIGSSMERLLANSLVDSHVIKTPIDIWSTGFHFPVGEHKWYKDIELPETFARNVNIHALRGHSSLFRAEAILNKKLINTVLGDGGLLTNQVFKTEKEKKYKLGIVAHMSERKNPIFKSIKNNIPNSTILNIFSTPDKFIKKLNQCEAIISTALHPIIVADSYNIPNLWINLSKDKKISMYKFDDYYSVFNQKANYFDLTQNSFTQEDLNKIIKNYPIGKYAVEDIQNRLIQAHPYSQKMHFLTTTEIRNLNSKRINMFLYKFIPFTKLRRRLRKTNAIHI